VDNSAGQLRGDGGGDFDSPFVLRLHPLEDRHTIPFPLLILIDELVAPMADQHQVGAVIELVCRDAIIAPGTIRAEGPDVGGLGYVDLLLGDGVLPQRLVAATEIAPAGGLAPKEEPGRVADMAAGHLGRALIFQFGRGNVGQGDLRAVKWARRRRTTALQGPMRRFCGIAFDKGPGYRPMWPLSG
jgi:hypothetical protein